MNDPKNQRWTDERVEALKQLWKEGKSASLIATSLGNGITRNAVIGKVHRLNLASHGRNAQVVNTRRAEKPPRPKTTKPHEPKSFKYLEPKVKALRLPKPEPLPLSDGMKVTVLHLSETTCKWPIGDPSKEDFCFCGHHPRDGSPYCEYHARMAYQPAQWRRIVTHTQMLH